MAPTKFVIPKKLGAVADLLYTTKERRLAQQKLVDSLQEQETKLRDYLIENLPKSESTGVAGVVCRASIVVRTVPQVADWGGFFKHIKKTGDFELLQKRVSSKAVEERWESGKEVPGVKKFNAVTVSLNKI